MGIKLPGRILPPALYGDGGRGVAHFERMAAPNRRVDITGAPEFARADISSRPRSVVLRGDGAQRGSPALRPADVPSATAMYAYAILIGMVRISAP